MFKLLKSERRIWKSFLLFIMGCFAYNFTQAQIAVEYSTISYAKKIIDTLTSATMNGRGYVDSSDWKAAQFIQHEMMEMNLQKFGETYFQPYILNANVFPGAMKVIVNGKQLFAGSDFLIEAASGSCKGKFKGVKVNKTVADTSLATIRKLAHTLMNQKNQDVFLFVAKDSFTKPQFNLWQQALDETNAFGARGVVECSGQKLTWDASQEQKSWCYIQWKGDMPATRKNVITVDIESEWKKNYSTQNVVGFIKGIFVPDSFLVFTAHYDHLGQMGTGTYFPGANDNASGTSMILNLAAYYSKHPSKYTVVLMLFSGEELGLLGSRYYVNHPLFPLGNIKFLVNLDIVGTGDEGIKVVNATEFSKQFDRLVKLNEQEQLLKVVSPRGKAANSDHYSFFEKGIPCFFIYTMGGIAAYHDVFDKSVTLPLTEYQDLFQLLIDFENTF